MSILESDHEGGGGVFFSSHDILFRVLQEVGEVEKRDLDLFVLGVKFPDREKWLWLTVREEGNSKFTRYGRRAKKLGDVFELLTKEQALEIGRQMPASHRWRIMRPILCDRELFLVEEPKDEDSSDEFAQCTSEVPAPKLPKRSDRFVAGECFRCGPAGRCGIPTDNDDEEYRAAEKACLQALGAPKWLKVGCPECSSDPWMPCSIQRDGHTFFQTNSHPARLHESFIEELPSIEREAVRCARVRLAFTSPACPTPGLELLEAFEIHQMCRYQPGFTIRGFFGSTLLNVPLEWPTADFDLAKQNLRKWLGRRGSQVHGKGVLREVEFSFLGFGFVGPLAMAVESKIQRILGEGRFPVRASAKEGIR